MFDEHERFDHELSGLARSLRRGDYTMASLQLAEFALELDHWIYGEEHALSSTGESAMAAQELAKLRGDHDNLRELIGAIASAVDRADDRGGLEAIGKLRSELLQHLAAEDSLLAVHN